MMRRKQLNRRLFLRGLGGACVAAPLLTSLRGRTVWAQPAVAPRRLIVMFTHYGCVTTRFFPAKAHGRLTAEDLAPTTLKHLAPYVDKLLLPRGIRAMNEWTSKMDRGQGNEPHYHVGSFLTCQPLVPNSDDPFGQTSAHFEPGPTGPSLDHVIAQQISPREVPLLMTLAGGAERPLSAISYSAAETRWQGSSPLQLFEQLTGLFESGAPLSPDSYEAARGKSIVDLVRDDLDTLARNDMSQADRSKLEAWKALLDDTGRNYAACSEEQAALRGVTRQNLQMASGGGGSTGDRLTDKLAGSDLDGADVASNLAALAAVCNLNSVIVLHYPGPFVFRGLGHDIDSHAVSHRRTDATMAGVCAADALDKLVAIDDFYARKFAKLLETLSSFSEGEASLLDNTATVWFQEQSDGAAHNLNNLPIVQAGSAGGYFKTGWAVNVEDGAAAMTSGNSEAACTATTSDMINGITQATGTDPSIGNVPINKYFCTLMNALGVKAGPDGFPAKGGAAEVTHFGMYDRTEDFIGGGTNPAMIHDPGELSALRA